MARRINQINELLKGELANLINREIFLENGLITITYVDCSPDLRYAKIGISVLPDNLMGTALSLLRKKSSSFSNILRKKLTIRFIPKLNWIIDNTEKEAAKIEKIINEIKNKYE